jgi:peptidoglycan/LPS O-acetylase OafA/YrhL
MLSSNRARFAYVLSLLAAFLPVLGLAIVVLKQALMAGTAEAWMMAGVLAVVVGLPMAMVVLSVASWLHQRLKGWSIVPYAGENVSGAGQ